MKTASETRERPVILYPHEVLAVLEGRQSQFRRPIKPQPEWIESSGRWLWRIPAGKVNPGCCTEVVTASREWWEYLTPNQWEYQFGDELWVQETWRPASWAADGGWGHIEYRDGFVQYVEGPWSFDTMLPIKEDPHRWRPSIEMPKWASRIRLRITDVRVERVQDISIGDARAEGIRVDGGAYDSLGNANTPERLFRGTWDSINGKRPGCSWAHDPWVWVISFERA